MSTDSEAGFQQRHGRLEVGHAEGLEEQVGLEHLEKLAGHRVERFLVHVGRPLPVAR